MKPSVGKITCVWRINVNKPESTHAGPLVQHMQTYCKHHHDFDEKIDTTMSEHKIR